MEHTRSVRVGVGEKRPVSGVYGAYKISKGGGWGRKGQ